MWWRGPCTVIAAWMMTGCTSSGVQSAIQPPPASLRQPCRTLTAPADGTGATMLRWSLDAVTAHRECADRHRALLDAWPG